MLETMTVMECLREAERILRGTEGVSPEYAHARVARANAWIELAKALMS